MKMSNSGILTNLKSNYFVAGAGINEISQSYILSNKKANNLQFELDRNREIIMKLRTELLNKKNEINMLKVKKNKKDGQQQRILRTLEEILKQSDQSTGAGFKAVESFLNSDKKKDRNLERINEIKEMIHLNEEQINSLKEIIHINRFKKEIASLSEDLNLKIKTINQIKKNNNNSNYTRLKNNFIKNFNELAQTKKQNEIIRKKMAEITNMLVAKKEDNMILKNKLLEFQKKFKDYKEDILQRTKSLEKDLKKAREKERNCRIFHINKNYSNLNYSFDYSKVLNNSSNILNNEENSKSNLNETDIKLNEAEQEMKKLSNDLNELKKEIYNKNNEIKQLNYEKKEVHNEIKILSSNNNKYLNQINSLNTQIQNLNKNNCSIEKENNELNQKIEELDSKYEDEKLNYSGLKEILVEKDKEINDLKKLIENLKKKNKDDLFFTGIGAIGKKKDDIVDTEKNIADELAQIEKKYEKVNQSNYEGN